jgi:hypothetical protein
MGTEDAPVCIRHDDGVAMSLRTLHSDQSAPEQVLGVYSCPECGSERRLPLAVPRSAGDSPGSAAVAE